jgi:hypothetical protein
LTGPGQDWLAEALSTRDIERVRPDTAAAGRRVSEARKHVRSARVLAEDDPALAVAACHDAVRKTVTAHMVANGLRPRGGEGAHRVVLSYARHVLAGVISSEDLEEAEAIRRDRALAEYGDYPTSQFSADHVRAAEMWQTAS